MDKQKYIYWQDEDMFLGYLEEYPDYWTQGTSLEELQQNLLDLYQNLVAIIFLLSEKLSHLNSQERSPIIKNDTK
jgi:predicted RNase H-like HicB family nuclease